MAGDRTIAFVGLGKMGQPMALRLLSAGFAVRGYDRDGSRYGVLSDAGMIACRSIGEAMSGADVLITMLPDGRSVRGVVISAEPARGTLVIDMSSSAPMGTRELGTELATKGVGLIDAPVSGGVAKAETGTLSIMAGGEPDLVARARPILQAMGERVFHAGALGAGHAVKALNNYVSAAGLVAACEALLVARAFGIDPGVLTDILNASTGRNNSTEVKLKPQILSGRFASGFNLALMAKDLATAADLAEGLGIARDATAAQAKLWARALDRLGHGADHTEIYRYLDTAEA